MKGFHWGSDNKGSVTILAIGIMAFLGIILSGVLPMITQEIRIGTMNRDVVEAQYAAESGLKRAIVGLEAGSTSWSWLTTSRQFTKEAGKTYTVSVQAASPNTLAEGTAPASGWYYLQAVGRVGNAKKTVSVKVNLASSGLSGVFTNGVFGNSSISSNSSTVTGNASTNGSFSGYNATVTGNLSVVGSNNSKDQYQKVTVKGTTTDSTSTPAATSVSVPTFSTSFTMPAAPVVNNPQAWPVGQSLWGQSGVNVPAGVYKLSGNWSVGQSTVTVQSSATLYATNGIQFDNYSTVTMGSNDILYSGSNLKIESNGAKLSAQTNATIYASSLELSNAAVLTVGDNALIEINGGVKLSGGSKLITQGASTIYIAGDFELSNNNDALTLGGDTTIYVGGQLIMSNTSKITTAANSNVVIKANSVKMSNTSSITRGTGGSLGILVEKTITLSNTTSITNALVIAKGDITLTGDGPTQVTGSVISVNGTVSMYNAKVTYDADSVSTVLTNNPGMITGGGATGGGGGNTVTTSEWKNL